MDTLDVVLHDVLLSEPPKSQWERAYDESVAREEELTKAVPGYRVHKAYIDLRLFGCLAGLVAAGLAWAGRALGVGSVLLPLVAASLASLIATAAWRRRR